jgi:hypothetical protein
MDSQHNNTVSSCKAYLPLTVSLLFFSSLVHVRRVHDKHRTKECANWGKGIGLLRY